MRALVLQGVGGGVGFWRDSPKREGGVGPKSPITLIQPPPVVPPVSKGGGGG